MIRNGFVALCSAVLLVCDASVVEAQGFGELVNAKDFGVTDSVANATPALQHAIDYVTTNHKRLWIPAGSYHITSPIVIDNKGSFSIVGDGPNETSIYVDSNNSAFLFSGACSQVELRDLWIGSSSPRSAGYGISIIGGRIYSDTFQISN